MNLADLFDLTLKGCSRTTALEFCGREWTFAQLEADSNRLAHHLTEIGFRPGDRLAVYLSNCPELIEAYLAAVKLGVVFTPVNALYREREIEHILADAQPRAILTSRGLAPYLPPAREVLLVEELARRLQSKPHDRPPCPATGDSAAVLVYTSGTTGQPKGALLTHNNLALNALTINACWRLSPADRVLMVLPLFHINGLANGLHTWLTVGFRVRLLDRFHKETILDEFTAFRPTFFFGVPTMYTRMLDAPPEAARHIGENMRLFISGAAPLSVETLDRFRGLYGQTILERYGMTEALGILSNPYAGERRPGTVGKPLPGVSVRLSEGEHGEILVKAPTVFAGYWRNEESTNAAFTADGYFRTGDLAERSPDGYYTLRGRLSDLIISGGFNIYPQEIEGLLTEQAGIRDAVVVGTPDPVRGERPLAYLVAESPEHADAASLRNICRQKLASYKVPQEFRFVRDLPRNALGKIQRHLLRESDAL